MGAPCDGRRCSRRGRSRATGRPHGRCADRAAGVGEPRALPASCKRGLLTLTLKETSMKESPALVLSPVLKGVFAGPTAGLKYQTPTLSGITTDDGQFQYRAG